jgi:hypothetical protein
VVVLAVAMLLFGGNLLMGGISRLRGAGAAGGSTAFTQSVLKDLQAVTQSTAEAHPVAVRVNAVSKVVLGLLLLFAVAAVFSADRRARTAALVAAWVGIGYHLGDAVFSFLVMRKGIVAAAPLLASLAASQSPGSAVLSAEEVVSLADLAVVVTGAVGIAFSVVLLAYFGGRKGRVFYGFDGAVGRQHGA